MRGDDADIEPLRFQHDALLDVQFEERLDVGTLCRGEPIRIAADPAQRRRASVSPPGSVNSSIDGSSAPAMPRLPTQDRPYSLGSSARKSMTSMV